MPSAQYFLLQNMDAGKFLPVLPGQSPTLSFIFIVAINQTPTTLPGALQNLNPL